MMIHGGLTLGEIGELTAEQWDMLCEPERRVAADVNSYLVSDEDANKSAHASKLAMDELAAQGIQGSGRGYFDRVITRAEQIRGTL